MRHSALARLAMGLVLAGATGAAFVACSDYGGPVGSTAQPGDDAAAPLDDAGATPPDDAGGPSARVSFDDAPPPPAADTPLDPGLNAAEDAGAADGARGTDSATAQADSGAGANPGVADGDSGAFDSGLPDAGAPDTGVADSGAHDSGALDTGTPDGGARDTGAPDTGAPDTGAPDTGPADTGAPDTGGPLGATEALVSMQTGKPGVGSCLDCAMTNGCFDPAQQGGTCEQLSGSLTHLATALPDGKTCTGVIGTEPVTEQKLCIQTLKNIFSSACAATLQETPCLCGTADVNGCLAGTATPNGPLYDLYACDLGSTNGATINSNFTVQTFGVGMGNALVQCLGAFGCNCF